MKKIKFIVIGVFTLIVGYYLFGLTYAICYKHKTVFNNYKQYLWLFNDSIQNKIDTAFCIGSVRGSDSYYSYLFKDKQYCISIWEINDLSLLQLNTVRFVQNINIDNLDFNKGERFNLDVLPFPKITVQFKLPFQNHLTVNINERSVIEKPIESTNYRGFFGKINKMSFSSNEGEHLILFDYGNTEQSTLFLMYKKNNRSYVILINSEKKFDESVINLLNLE